MKLGVGSYTYMWSIGVEGAAPEKPMDARALLERAAELGVKVVQYGPNLPLDALSMPQREALVARAQELGIEIEVGTRGIEAGTLRPQIAMARNVGATLLRSVPELSGGRTPTRWELVGNLRPMLAELEDARVRLAPENSKMPAMEFGRGPPTSWRVPGPA